jgi:hypothetical protein
VTYNQVRLVLAMKRLSVDWDTMVTENPPPMLQLPLGTAPSGYSAGAVQQGGGLLYGAAVQHDGVNQPDGAVRPSVAGQYGGTVQQYNGMSVPRMGWDSPDAARGIDVGEGPQRGWTEEGPNQATPPFQTPHRMAEAPYTAPNQMRQPLGGQGNSGVAGSGDRPRGTGTGDHRFGTAAPGPYPPDEPPF